MTFFNYSTSKNPLIIKDNAPRTLYPLILNDHVDFGLEKIPTQSQIPKHSHSNQSEILFIYKGKAKVTVNEQSRICSIGEVVYIQKGEVHEIVNVGEEELWLTYTLMPPSRGLTEALQDKKESRNYLFMQIPHAVLQILRPYQKECIDVTLKYLENTKTKRMLVSLPVGSGKTLIMSCLSGQFQNTLNKKSLMLGWREEGIQSIYNTVKKVWPNKFIDIEKANKKANVIDAEIIIASVPSLIRGNRLDKYLPEHFESIFVDEAHHSVAQSYMKIFDHFNILNNNENQIYLWGCTATASRFDQIALGKVYEEIIYHKPLKEMILHNWLCDIEVISIETNISIDEEKVEKGNEKVLSSIRNIRENINTEQRNDLIIKEWLKLSEKRNFQSTLIFATSIQHCHGLLEALKKQNPDIKAACLTSHTKTADRFDIMKQFRNRELSVLITCSIVTEGTDIPAIDCILMARPTKSIGLFQQMIGRGMRLYPGKSHCLLVDFVDNYTKNYMLPEPTLDGEERQKKTGKIESSELKKSPPLEKEEEIEFDTSIKINAKTRKQLGSLLSHLKSSKFSHLSKSIKIQSDLAWTRISSKKEILALNIFHGRYLTVEYDKEGTNYSSYIIQTFKNKSTIKTQLEFIGPNLDEILNNLENHLYSTYNIRTTLMKKTAKWRKMPASKDQLKFLIDKGGSKFLLEALTWKLEQKKKMMDALQSKSNEDLIEIGANYATKGDLEKWIMFIVLSKEI